MSGVGAVRFLGAVTANLARNPLTARGEMLVSLTFASWNQIAAWLRQLDRMRATG